MLSLTLALTSALMVQTASAAAPQATDSLTAQTEEVMALVNRMFATLGTCERVLPPEVGEQLRAGLADENDPDSQVVLQSLMATYDAGKASPEAATITQGQCLARINAIGAEMNVLKAELEATVAAAQ
ncbi:hypothetical protein GCM10009422_18910 [Brevundimonas kwangchunensis]|uniref:Uncharacterized protein n=1 Tax=Brevundimonas kwangchunensis TaxID=322163 RepID=A0ABN1GXW1_9CAUL